MERQVERPMDPLQATRLLLWLDEEHRKDKAELQFLREKLGAQSPVNENYAGQLRELSGQLAVLKSQTARIAPLEETLNQAKGQAAQLKEQLERFREESERADVVRRSEVEHLLKSRTSVEQRLEEIAREAAAPGPRLQAISEEFKRVVAIFPQFEAVRQQLSALAARIPAFETEDRRSSDRLTAIERSLEDIKNAQVRIQEEHRLGVEEQRHAVENSSAAVQAVQRRFDEKTTALQHLVAERAKDQEGLISIQAQLDGLRQAQPGSDSRVTRLEEQLSQREAQLLRLQATLEEMQQDVTRVSHLQAATEERLAQELPELRKLTSDWEGVDQQLQGQYAEMALEHQRERDELMDVRRQVAALVERQAKSTAMLLEFQEQTLRAQANALAMRIQDIQRIPRPQPGAD